ncbi:MAG: TonB-dependent receptor [Lysobacterales bacterium]
MLLRKTMLFSSIIAVLAGSSTARAQSAEADAKDQQTLDAVMVTATKRATPLQQTPIAITAIGSETLEKERVMTVQDITSLVPGFSATTQGDHGVITLTLRGIGNDSAKTEYADPEVALFVDGIYTPRAEGAAALLLDLESVEVLRGPQGTLWGRNSTVGAVNMQTAKPELGDTSGTVQFGLGNYARLGGRGAFNVALSDTWAMRVAYAHEEHEGYVEYQNPGELLPSVASQQAAYLASGGTAATFQPINPNLFVSGGDRYNAQNQTAVRISSLWQPSDAYSWNLSYEKFRDTGTPNANLMQRPRAGQDFWSTLADVRPYLDRDVDSIRSRMDWQINDDIALSYIAGYSKFDGSSDYDQDGGVQVPTSFTTGATYQQDRTNYSEYENYSHEFDLKSTGEGELDWILGVYYAAEQNKIRFDIPIFNGTQQGTVAWQGSFIQPKQTVDSRAVFGQITWHASDDLRLTGGLRYTDDSKENIGGRGWGWQGYGRPEIPQVPIAPGTIPSNANGFGFGVGGINDGEYNHGQLTWLARADYDVSDDFLLYGSVSTGYKSGGLQDGGVPYKHEELTNFEFGTKLSFWDGQIVWNNAVYYQDFKDFQLAAPIIFTDGSRGLGFSNVSGSTKVWGFESELNARLSDRDRLQLVFSAIPKKELGTLLYAGSNDYQGLPACPPVSGISNCLDVSGNELAHAPDAALHVVYEHDFELSNGALLTPRISAHFETESWLSPFNLGEGDRQKGYHRSDLSLRYAPASGAWYADVYVDNVEDGKVRTNAGRTAVGNGQFVYLSQYLPPRTVGLNVGFWF